MSQENVERLRVLVEDFLAAGLRSGATAADVLARAEADNAPFTQSEDLKAWVTQGLRELS